MAHGTTDGKSHSPCLGNTSRNFDSGILLGDTSENYLPWIRNKSIIAKTGILDRYIAKTAILDITYFHALSYHPYHTIVFNQGPMDKHPQNNPPPVNYPHNLSSDIFSGNNINHTNQRGSFSCICSTYPHMPAIPLCYLHWTNSTVCKKNKWTQIRYGNAQKLVEKPLNSSVHSTTDLKVKELQKSFLVRLQHKSTEVEFICRSETWTK